MANFTPINRSSKASAAEEYVDMDSMTDEDEPNTEELVESNPEPSEKNRVTAKPSRKAQSIKSVDQESDDIEKDQPGKKNGPDYAVPIETRRNAIPGTKDETLLRIACRRNDAIKELVFSNISHEDIDWNDAHHIRKINCWRQQIFSRGGLKTRDIQTWHSVEEAFMRLYVLALIKRVVDSDEPVKLPSTAVMLEDFNQVFKGTVLQDKNGNNLEPRVARTISNFSSKFCRAVGPLKKYLAKVSKGVKCEVFRPDINLKAAQRFERDELSIPDPEKGTEKDWEELLEDIKTFKRKVTTA